MAEQTPPEYPTITRPMHNIPERKRSITFLWMRLKLKDFVSIHLDELQVKSLAIQRYRAQTSSLG